MILAFKPPRQTMEPGLPATSDTWRRELLAHHWLPQAFGCQHPLCEAMIDAVPFALPEGLSMPLLGAMTKGLGQAFDLYFNGVEPDHNGPGCTCFFPEESAGLCAHAPFENTWIETADIEGCQWGMLSCRTRSAQVSGIGGMHLSFVKLPQLEEALVFFGTWCIPRENGYWNRGRLSQAQFGRASAADAPIVSSWARMLDAPRDLDCAWRSIVSQGASYPLEYSGAQRAVLDESIGTQLTIMLLTAQAAISGGTSIAASH